jgi:hypothetical protein
LGFWGFGVLGKFISFFPVVVGNLDFGEFGFWDFGKIYIFFSGFTGFFEFL